MLDIVIAEDHSLVRDSLRLLLSVQTDMRLVAETGDGRQVVALVQQYQPALLLLDLGLPGLDGLAVMQALAECGTSTRVLVVTARLDAASVRSSLALGAAGYLPKTENAETLLTAMRCVAAGETYVHSSVAELFEPQVSAQDVDDMLTPREREILSRVGAGLSSKEIAKELGISDLTVRKHRENLCRKLGARNAPELVAIAIRLGV